MLFCIQNKQKSLINKHKITTLLALSAYFPAADLRRKGIINKEKEKEKHRWPCQHTFCRRLATRRSRRPQHLCLRTDV
jgi:hypothetical protein